jgi:hypothetical protein
MNVDAINEYKYYASECLFRNLNGIIFMPPSLCTELISLFHDSPVAGYPGRDHTISSVKHFYWWPGTAKDIASYIDHCQLCSLTKGLSKPLAGKLMLFPIPSHPWKDISFDFVTRLPLSNGFDSIGVIIDRFSKEIVLFPCLKTTSSSDLAMLFRDHIWCLHRPPNTILSDRGPQFISEFTKELCKVLGIQQKLSMAYHSQMDGQMEWVNREVIAYLCAYITKQQETWASWLKMA